MVSRRDNCRAGPSRSTGGVDGKPIWQRRLDLIAEETGENEATVSEAAGRLMLKTVAAKSWA